MADFILKEGAKFLLFFEIFTWCFRITKNGWPKQRKGGRGGGAKPKAGRPRGLRLHAGPAGQQVRSERVLLQHPQHRRDRHRQVHSGGFPLQYQEKKLNIIFFLLIYLLSFLFCDLTTYGITRTNKFANNTVYQIGVPTCQFFYYEKSWWGFVFKHDKYKKVKCLHFFVLSFFLSPFWKFCLLFVTKRNIIGFK